MDRLFLFEISVLLGCLCRVLLFSAQILVGAEIRSYFFTGKKGWWVEYVKM
jgi:hypothetical protein